ncbi:MAG TPA: hypothetical protein VF575_03220 [Candidatus Saccharimonadales bacterium]|jgi:hypothetical protein
MSKTTPNSRFALLHRHILLFLVATTFVAVGIAAALSIRAATPFISAEPENGTISSDAGSIISDVTASAGKAVNFAAAVTPPPPTGIHRFPYSFGDTQFFTNMTASSPIRLGCETRSNLTITTHAEPASVNNNCGSGTSTINRVRLGADVNGGVREGYRCNGSGTMVIQNSWLEAQGIGDDHADVIQCYNPNNSPTATMRVSNTTIRGYNSSATAGLFVADSYAADVYLSDVLFWGAPYGLRIHTDGRPGKLYMNNICFYGTSYADHSFRTGPMLLSPYTPSIMEWNNVNWCTISNGNLVVHGSIPRP